VSVATQTSLMGTANIFEKVDGGGWIQSVGIRNYPAPAYLSASTTATSLTATASSLDGSKDVYYDSLVNPSGPQRGAGPIGKTDATGTFRGTFDTSGWVRGTYKFRLYTNTTGGGFRTSNEITITR